MTRDFLFSRSLRIAVFVVIGINSFGYIEHLCASDARSSARDQPSVYISTNPNICANFGGLEYQIFVNSPSDNNLNGIRFNLDITGSAPIPLVIPEAGVILRVLDIFEFPYHIEATWTSQPLEHEPIIKLLYSVEPTISEFLPYNVIFETTGGGSMPGIGLSSLTCCVDCFNCSLGIFAPNHVFVPIGETIIIPFEWAWYCWYPGGGPLTVNDSESWVLSWAPEYAGDQQTCGLCIIPIYDGWIEVFVPEGVPVGSLSTLSIVGWESTEELILEAEDVIPVVNTSWGKIKSLYR